MNNNNYCVIMSGGVGSRFWPYSTEGKPKQFLDFFGTGKSLLQSTYDRFVKIVPAENIFIVTNAAYSKLTIEQLPQLKKEQILLEPIRRNTAPAIAYALYRISVINPDANIVVAPSDHLILNEKKFAADIREGLEFVASNDALLTLGIKPSRPETGYGYIQVSQSGLQGINKVKAFTEKPNLELAKQFIKSGEFMWNAGIFMWNVDAIMKAYRLYLPEIVNQFDKGKNCFNKPEEQDFIDKCFPFCPNISVDYGILEKADNVYVKISNFGWSDLGTWGALYEMSRKDDNGNSALNSDVLFIESNDNIVAMHDNKLVVMQGLDDYIVAESDKSLLICKRSEEQRIKHFVADVKFKFGDEFI